ncbi:hypothetical protein ACJX0J_022535 [Zea mays]
MEDMALRSARRICLKGDELHNLFLGMEMPHMQALTYFRLVEMMILVLINCFLIVYFIRASGIIEFVCWITFLAELLDILQMRRRLAKNVLTEVLICYYI